MNTMDIVLYNDCNCEIARETITKERTEDDIVADWEIRPGDTIKIEEAWHEE